MTRDEAIDVVDRALYGSPERHEAARLAVDALLAIGYGSVTVTDEQDGEPDD